MVTLVMTLLLPACASVPGAPTSTTTPTATRAATNTPEPTATNTSTPTKTPLPTKTPNLAATEQYESFYALVQKYYEAGQIPSTNGKYKALNDFESAYAFKLSYSWGELGLTAKNFIVRADFEWSNSIDTVNTSGCGFVYRLQSNEDHYLILLDAYNGVKLASSTDRGTYSMGPPQKGDKKITDFGTGPYKANFTLIVNDLKSYVYVNDIYFGEYDLLEYRITEPGPLAGAVLSASSVDYGTRCTMTNISSWVIEP